MTRLTRLIGGSRVRATTLMSALVVVAAFILTRRGGGGSDPIAAPERPAGATAAPQDDEVRYTRLENEGVAGGEVVFTVPGKPADVLAMLLDFAEEPANRIWRIGCKVLAHEADRWEIEAVYSGKAGINPTVVLEHTVARDGDGVIVRFRVCRAGFGLRTFDGEYEIRPLRPGFCRLRERVFIDSGLPFVNADADDVKKGLMKDVDRIRDWMTRRLAG